MGFKEQFKNFFTPSDEEYDEFEQDIEEEKDAPEQEKKSFELGSLRGGSKEKVVNISSTQLQVVLVKPERFEDAPAIADHLKARHTVVLNLENAPREIVRRLVDFLSGVAYANNGQIKRAANNTFVITPSNVDVTGDAFFDEPDSYYR